MTPPPNYYTFPLTLIETRETLKEILYAIDAVVAAKWKHLTGDWPDSHAVPEGVPFRFAGHLESGPVYIRTGATVTCVREGLKFPLAEVVEVGTEKDLGTDWAMNMTPCVRVDMDDTSSSLALAGDDENS